MYKTSDIKNLLIQELHNHNVKDCGYDCFNGRKYVELRNVIFEVDKNKIFDKIPPLERMTEQWYIDNYDPILNRNNQLAKCIKRLIDNPNSRQAVIIMGDVNEYNNPVFICTMYMHVFLIQQSDGNYILEYTVHMRSNDVIEFDTDIMWHYTVINKIVEALSLFYTIDHVKVFWNADTIHLYEQFWEDALKES